MSRILKVCFYGPESTGKSVLAKKMAEFYKTEFVPEVAREFITSNNFTAEDIVRIGNEQTRRIQEMEAIANKVLFCDTDLITTQIYSRQYLGFIPPVLHELERKISYDKYFLFDIDVPWVADGLRDLETERPWMYKVFKDELEVRGIAYRPVRGSFEERTEVIREEVDRMIGK